MKMIAGSEYALVLWNVWSWHWHRDKLPQQPFWGVPWEKMSKFLDYGKKNVHSGEWFKKSYTCSVTVISLAFCIISYRFCSFQYKKHLLLVVPQAYKSSRYVCGGVCHFVFLLVIKKQSVGWIKKQVAKIY